MIPRLLDRWRRRLDLDQVRPKRGVLKDYIAEVLDPGDEAGSRRSTELLLRYILLQALLDGALGVHLFYDEDDACLRMLYCLAVPRTDAKRQLVTASELPFDGPRLEWAGAFGGEFAWPDPANPAYMRVWYEMLPPSRGGVARFFDRLGWYAGLRPDGAEGKLRIHVEGRDLSAVVLAPRTDDVRLFFGAERPPIRPKLKRHFEELGLPFPG